MPADIVIASDKVFPVAHDNDTLIRDLLDEVIAGLSYLAYVPGQQPMP